MRGAMFNIIQEAVEGADICDAFAGSGAVGLEALSRGARHAMFIEKDRVAADTVAANIRQLGVDDRAKLIRATVAAWHGAASEALFDLIIADPPYHDMQLSTVSLLATHLKPNGLMVLSHQGRESAPTVNGVVVVDKRSYGDAALAFYRPV